MGKPRLLDLFCGAGGAAMGYHRAGFEVIGVDINPQPHYPFEFHQSDALTYPLDGFDAYHASPPCQGYFHLKRGENLNSYPLLIDSIRDIFKPTKKPFCIENIPSAKEFLINPIMLCGTMFGLPLWKHRYFEIYPELFLLTNTCNHKQGTIKTDLGEISIPVYCSHGGDSRKGIRPSRIGWRWRPQENKEIQLYAMGIDWGILPRKSIHEAIPPAYTEYIGKYLIQSIKGNNS